MLLDFPRALLLRKLSGRDCQRKFNASSFGANRPDRAANRFWDELPWQLVRSCTGKNEAGHRGGNFAALTRAGGV